MKKLILSSLMILGSLFCKGQIAPIVNTDVYLQHMPIYNYTHISTNGTQKTLEFTGACAVLGPDNLKLACDSANGIYPVGSDMHIPEYYEVNLINPCTLDTIGEGYKEEFYLTPDGTQFPYEVRNGSAYNLVQNGTYGYDSAEWDTLIHYGTPDTMIAWNPTSGNTGFDPATDCVTGVLYGHSDAYNGNSFDITNVPDGIYIFRVIINLPNYVHDPGKYPNFVQHLCSIQGNSFTWVDSYPSCCSGPLVAPTNCVATGTSLSWNAVPNACGYVIQRWLVKGNNQIQASGPIKRTTGTTFVDTDNIPKGQYAWYIKAENGSFGPEGHTNKVNIK